MPLKSRMVIQFQTVVLCLKYHGNRYSRRGMPNHFNQLLGYGTSKLGYSVELEKSSWQAKAVTHTYVSDAK